MGRPNGWASELTGRAAMRSPGRPPVASRVDRVVFWLAVGDGMTTVEAAKLTGVSEAVGVRWFRDGGGMPTVSLAPLSGRYLSFAEREEIALLRAQGAGVREIARRVGRSPSTISRELRRNAATRGGKLEYRASVAQWKAERMARRPKTAKLAADDRLREYVQERLSGQVRRPDGTAVPGPATRPWNGRNKPRRQDRRWARAWSPEQISNRLRLDFPDDESMRISHEAIYQALYRPGPRRAQARARRVLADRAGASSAEGSLAARQELRQRRDHDQRAARRGGGPGCPGALGGRSDPRDSATPRSGRWWSARRASRCCCISHRPRTASAEIKNGPPVTGHGGEQVRDAIAAAITTLPEQLRRSLTWDQGAEMAEHAKLRIDTGLQVYFCDPQSPWQRGTNENTNGLLRQYFPRGTDLARHTAEELAAVAEALNGRPRKTLGWRTPAEALTDHLASAA